MNKFNFNSTGSHERNVETGRDFAQRGNQAEKENEKKAVVVIFGGGATSKSEFVIGPRTVAPGAAPPGLGEASVDDNEAQSIAQQIANDYPKVEVIVSGPTGINEISTKLINNPPKNILIYGFSSGASSATALTNQLTKRGIYVDQVTTVDPQGFNVEGAANAAKTRANPKDAAGLFVIGTPEINNPEKVGNALNLVGTNKAQVKGANQTEITRDWAQRKDIEFNHRNMDDIASRFVIKRIEFRLSEIMDESRQNNVRHR